MKLIREGKTKKVFFDPKKKKFFLQFKNDITAFNMKKHEIMAEKGEVNCEITTILFGKLKEKRIPMAFKRRAGKDLIEVSDVRMIPIEVVVRNIAYGSILKRYNFKEGFKFSEPLVEFFYKDDARDDPPISPRIAELLKVCRREDFEKMEKLAIAINDVLKTAFRAAGITLVDFKIEFGFNEKGRIVLSDEIDPDSCRLWDKKGEMLDKERFRKGMGNVMESYKEILRRLKRL